MSRSTAREVAFKTIYSQMFNSQRNIEQDKDDLYDELTDPDDFAFVTDVLKTTAAHYSDINEIITKNLVGYTKDRVFKVDFAIIFVALCELLYIKENTPAVIVNEAVNIAKKYSTEKSPKFVNGFLADIIKKAVE